MNKKSFAIFLAVGMACATGAQVIGVGHGNTMREDATLTTTRQGIEELWKTFKEPPVETRTKVWWFHGETETTREGITADLEAFRKAGVGGVVYYDQVHGKAEQALDAFSPEWWQMFVFAASEAKRLGLSFETHISNGYVAGGPWITPELGMRMLTAVDTVIDGSRHYHGALPGIREKNAMDIAVMAFPVPQSGWQSLPVISKDKLLTFTADSTHYIYFETQHKPFTARSLTYRAGKRGKATTSATNVPGPPAESFVGTGYVELPDMGELEWSDDGVTYHSVCPVPPIYNAHGSWNRKTVSFPAVTAKYFRLKLHDWWTTTDRGKPLRIGDITLSSQPHVMRWEEKAGLVSEYIDHTMNTTAYPADDCIRSADVVDLTSHYDAQTATLDWQMPKGRWVVMRFAHVPTGAKTKHGRRNLIGLECDKMSRKAAEVQWRNYYKVMSDTLKHHSLRIDGLAMDSHEAGSQNWTEGFQHKFHLLRGYSLLRYLPVMAGYVVDSAERSDSVLRDVRRTIADLVSSEYYGALDSLCRQDSVPFTAQAIGNALCLVGDPIQAKGRVTKPQGEFWAIHPDGNYDIKESSSAAHLYGKPIASGEAFTDAKYGQPLSFLKQLADGAYCYGINEFVVCASAYQPWTNRMPGSTGGGRHYCLNRNNTYWHVSQPFWLYQARCALMMRQGRSVNDLCLYLGDDAPVKILTYRLPELPSGYDFDAFTADALRHRMKAEDGKVVLPDGMSYRAILIPRRSTVSAEADTMFRQLHEAGVPVWHEGEEELAEFLHANGILLDVSMKHSNMKDLQVWYAHRQTQDADIYFINNHSEVEVCDDFLFRHRRSHAQWWDALSGQRYRLRQSTDGSIQLRLQGKQAGMVVWTDDANEQLPILSTTADEHLMSIDGEWTLTFPDNKGDAISITIDSLTDWTEHHNPKIRYYSGTAEYETTFRLTQRIPKERRVMLSFQRMCDVAEVEVNGTAAGTVWCSPWQADITDYIKKGKNTLRIKVTNSLVNRMIGDTTLPETERTTYSYPPIVSKNDPLQSSGIIGTVKIHLK